MHYGQAIIPLAASAWLASAMVGAVAQAQPVAAGDKAHIAPTGELRAALVTIPFLAKPDAAGKLKGVAPDLAEEMARRLEIPYRPMRFDTPNAGIKALREDRPTSRFSRRRPSASG